MEEKARDRLCMDKTQNRAKTNAQKSALLLHDRNRRRIVRLLNPILDFILMA